MVDDKDGEVGKVGYEISFRQHFYKYSPPRPLQDIEFEIQEIKKVTSNLIEELLG